MEEKSVSVMPRPSTRTMRVDWARFSGMSGRTQSRKARDSVSGSKVTGGRSGWVRVTVPVASSVRASMAMSAGTLAPRENSAQGAHSDPSARAASWATAQRRS